MYFLRRISQLTRIGFIAASRDSAERKQFRMVELLITMGGVYIKFAQLMLLRLNSGNGTSHYDYGFLLKQTYDATPIESMNAPAIIANELGSKADQLLDISERPIASGSFGQVYSARLDDKRVIVKIVKPSVIANIKHDLRLLGLVTWLLNLSSNRAINIRDLFVELREVILRELDYRAEAYQADKLHEIYKEHRYLMIPQTYLELSTQHIIVQDRIQGVALTEVMGQSDVQPDVYVQRVVGSNLAFQMSVVGQEMLTAMLSGGLTHGDPHPGNIMLLPGNKVALIDFGICTPGPANRRAFFDLVTQYRNVYVYDQFNIEQFTLAITELFADDLMGAIRSLDRYKSGEISQQVIRAIQDGVRTMYDGAGRDIDALVQDHKFMQIFDSVVNENNRFGLTVTVDQPAFIRATLLYISLMKSLGIKNDVLATVYGNVCEAFSGYHFAQSTPHQPPEQAVAVIAEWLEQVASRDVFLYRLLTARIGRGVLYV